MADGYIRGTVAMLCVMSFLRDARPMEIKIKFVNGSVQISWNQPDPSQVMEEYATFTGDSRVVTPWTRVEKMKFSITDVLNYSSIQLTIQHRYRNFSFSESQFETKVNKQFFNEGDTGMVSWNIHAFPLTGLYAIFHSNTQILKVGLQDTSSIDQNKYIYLSTPTSSTNVKFRIRNITTADAGTYKGGVSMATTVNEFGILVVVFGVPKKPNIIGQTAVSPGNDVTLECSSKSTSTPVFYKQFPSITYKWYRNNSYITSGKILRLRVDENLYKDFITCQAKEELLSDHSDVVKIVKPNCTERNIIKSKFKDGNAVFSLMTTGSGKVLVFVTLNSHSGADWMLQRNDVENQTYTLKNCLKYSTIEVDVASQHEVCRSVFTNNPDTLIVQKEQNATIQWSIPFFPLSGSYKLFHSVRGLKEIISIDGAKVVSGNPMKYMYKSNPVHSTKITFGVNNVEAGDSGIYVGGQSRFGADDTRGVLLIVAGEPEIPTIKANNDAKYGEGISLTCQSSSTTFPEYYRELLPWSYTWYRNGSEVYHGSTYSFITSRVNMHDEIVCRAKEVTASIKSKIYKIRLVKSTPVVPDIISTVRSSPSTLTVTWESWYDGGSPQYFLIYQYNNILWNVVANVSDTNTSIHSAEVPPGTGGLHGVAVQACNIFGCSMPSKLGKATESDETLKDVENGDLGVAVGVSVSVIISIMLLVLFGLLHMKYGLLERCSD
ncbi:uncharacterized protein LOC125652294 [Ostrea edulis]|uniref:uncharacterized protein LOC125652294 n=1 Tax=Ostrea edulis TaxID=37623 RepID=UPI0024AFB42D|nr:uncharacterized protein LOC125652294 [Ostrea edulis]